MKTKHTEDELKVDIAMDEERWGYSILISTEKETIGSIFGDTQENCQSNADRIVKSVNMHDELVDALETIQEYHGKMLLPVIKFCLKDILKRTK